MRALLVVAALAGAARAASADSTDADVSRTVSTGGATFVFRSGRTANLAFELDCLADLTQCSKGALETAMALTAEDRAAIAVWKGAIGRYRGSVDPFGDGGSAPDVPVPLAWHPRDVSAVLRVALFTARDTDDALARLALFASNADVDRAAGVIRHFAARAETRWRTSRATLDAAVQGYAALQARPDLVALLPEIAKFYGWESAPPRQTFVLVWRPSDKSSTHAEQLGETGVIEVTEGDPPADMFPVVEHEMFHAWFAGSPIAQQIALQQRFLASPDPLALPGYELLDEVLATALGNGLVARAVDRADFEKRLAMPKGFYNDRFIDAAAKALLPALEARLAAKGSVYDPAFLDEYLRALHAAFPHGVPPIAHLRAMARVTDAAMAPVLDQLDELVHGNYTETDVGNTPSSRETLASHASWGRVIAWSRKDLPALRGLVEPAAYAQLAAAARRGKPFVLVTRGKRGPRFVLIADDPAAMATLVAAFGAVADGPLRDGILPL